MENDPKFLCYLDILGFKTRINGKQFKECYESIIEKVRRSTFGSDIYCIADSIIIIGENFRHLVDQGFAIYTTALSEGMFIRGAIAKGQVEEISSFSPSEGVVVMPFLGEAYLKAYELEQSINCAGICLDELVYKELEDDERQLTFHYKELFPKRGLEKEKIFLISNMDNWSVPQTILYKISGQTHNLSNHDLLKFLDTFCLYYTVMRKKHQDTNNMERYQDWWIAILDKLSSQNT